MNTPEPCCSCINCRYDAMEEDDPNASAWCELGRADWGNKDCPKYEHYERRDRKAPDPRRSRTMKCPKCGEEQFKKCHDVEEFYKDDDVERPSKDELLTDLVASWRSRELTSLSAMIALALIVEPQPEPTPEMVEHARKLAKEDAAAAPNRLTGKELAQGLGADQVKAMGFSLTDVPIGEAKETK